MIGMVYLVGAGCGECDLITVRGAELLKSCDAVVYDSLIDLSLLDTAPDDAEKICVGKRFGSHSYEQSRINQILVKLAESGKTVVRLKGGDPFVFGRGGEEAEALQQSNIPFEIVPGVTSAVAAAELSGIPVTHRKVSRSFTVITGHTADGLPPNNMREYAKVNGTLVFLMGLHNLSYIADSLIENGKSADTPTAVISKAGCHDSKTVRATLSTIHEKIVENSVQSPAVIVIGEVAELDFLSSVKLPLSGVTVTVTGTCRHTDKLSLQLRRLGAEVNCFSTLRVVEYENTSRFDMAVKSLQEYTHIVLTSINGAEIFVKGLRRNRIDIRSLANIKIAVIGSGTAKVMENYGIYPDIMPSDFTTEKLGRIICEQAQGNEKILILRAEKGSEILNQLLEQNGIAYDDVKTYDVVSNLSGASTVIDTDFITFASASGVEAFFESGYEISQRTKIVCIGEVTAQKLKECGVKDFKISQTKSVEGIAEAIECEVSLIPKTFSNHL